MIGEIIARKELLFGLVARNLKIRYKGSALGFLWSLMDPMLMVAVYFAFAKLTRFQVDLPYLLSGVLVWQFISLCVGDSFHSVVGNPNLVKKVYFPRSILPLSMTLANLVNYFLTLVVLFGFLLLVGTHIPWTRIWLIPFFIFIQFILCLGFSFLFSSLMVYFRDTQHLVSIGLMAWFFLSPVIYPAALVPEKIFWIYQMNPMCLVLMGFRYCLLGQDFHFTEISLIPILISLFFLGLGAWVFLKLEPYFSDEL